MAQELKLSAKEETPVDEVRRIREGFEKDADGDIQKLCDMYNKVAEGYRKKLEIEPVSPPETQDIRIGNKG